MKYYIREIIAKQMTKKAICSLVFSLMGFISYAQYFHDFNYFFRDYSYINQTRHIFCDTSVGKTYFTGEHIKLLHDTINDVVLEYDGDSMRVLLTVTGNYSSSNLISAARFNGKLYISGSNSDFLRGRPTTMLVYDGLTWDTLPAYPMSNDPYNSYVSAMTVHDGKLFICGVFDSIGTLPCANFAYLDSSGTWHAIDQGTCPERSGGYIPYCMAFYHDTLYAGGTIIDTCHSSMFQLIRYNGTSWESVPGWTIGSYSVLESMVVFQDKLYVAGGFDSGDGISLGNNIVMYNGAGWSSPGAGTNSGINAMCLADGKLFVTGIFTSVDGIPDSAFASWDGHQWCQVDRKMINPNGVTDCASMGDTTIFLSGGFATIGGDTFFRHAYWTGLSNTYLCGTNHGVGMNEVSLDYISVSPIPASDKLIINTTATDFNISISDISGREIAIANTKYELDISSLSAGIYYLRIHSRDTITVRRFVKE